MASSLPDEVALYARRWHPLEWELLPATLSSYGDYCARFRDSGRPTWAFLALLAEAQTRGGQLCLEHRDFASRLGSLHEGQLGAAVALLKDQARATPAAALELLRGALEGPEDLVNELCQAVIRCSVPEVDVRIFLSMYEAGPRLAEVTRLLLPPLTRPQVPVAVPAPKPVFVPPPQLYRPPPPRPVEPAETSSNTRPLRFDQGLEHVDRFFDERSGS